MSDSTDPVDLAVNATGYSPLPEGVTDVTLDRSESVETDRVPFGWLPETVTRFSVTFNPGVENIIEPGALPTSLRSLFIWPADFRSDRYGRALSHSFSSGVVPDRVEQILICTSGSIDLNTIPSSVTTLSLLINDLDQLSGRYPSSVRSLKIMAREKPLFTRFREQLNDGLEEIYLLTSGSITPGVIPRSVRTTTLFLNLGPEDDLESDAIPPSVTRLTLRVCSGPKSPPALSLDRLPYSISRLSLEECRADPDSGRPIDSCPARPNRFSRLGSLPPGLIYLYLSGCSFSIVDPLPKSLTRLVVGGMYNRGLFTNSAIPKSTTIEYVGYRVQRRMRFVGRRSK